METLGSFEMAGNEKPRQSVAYPRRMDSQLFLVVKLIKVLLCILEKSVIWH